MISKKVLTELGMELRDVSPPMRVGVTNTLLERGEVPISVWAFHRAYEALDFLSHFMHLLGCSYDREGEERENLEKTLRHLWENVWKGREDTGGTDKIRHRIWERRALGVIKEGEEG